MKTGKPDPEQYKRFVETVRELGYEEDKERFEEKLKRIAAAKPKPAPKRKTPNSD